MIIVVLAGATLWSGRRARQSDEQQRLLDAAAARGTGPLSAAAGAGWAGEYWAALAHAPRDSGASLDLLHSLTNGLGVALFTTMVGLVGNILLGMQPTRLDRPADALVADARRYGLTLGARAN